MIYRWEELREEEFKDAIEKSGGLCIVPIGCTEVHGEHLPAGCDYYQARAYAEAAAEKEDVVIFPTGFWMGDVSGASNIKDPIGAHKAGYVCLTAELRTRILSEICDEIARNGFRKVLIVNNHGGNKAWLFHFTRAHLDKPRNYATMYTNAHTDNVLPAKLLPVIKENPERFSYLTEEDMKTLERFAETGCGGGHGHICETAVVQTIVPHCVNVQRSAEISGLSTHRADYLENEGIAAGFTWGENYPNAFEAFDSVGSTPTIGRAMLDVASERLARIYKMLKEDEDCVRMAQGLPKE